MPGIAASRLLFVGVPPLREFGYREIRTFARKALAALATQAPQTRDLILTIHGAGYGLDEVEAFEAEVAGLEDAVREDDHPETLQKITIVERNVGRANRLASSLIGLLPEHTITKARSSDHTASASASAADACGPGANDLPGIGAENLADRDEAE